MKEKFLPIGSVVIMKEAQKKVMITGFLAMGKETGQKTYDYIGCIYPEGVLSSDQNLLFDHDQIGQVFFEGYVDEEQKLFMQKLKAVLATIEKEKAKDETNQQTESVDSLDENIEPIPLGETAQATSVPTQPTVPSQQTNIDSQASSNGSIFGQQ